MCTPWAYSRTFSCKDTDVELHTIPLFHANGWGRPQSITMKGSKHVMVRRFEPAIVFRLIQEEKATAMTLVPTMANALLNCPELGKFDTSSMRVITIGGAASSPELIARLEQAFHCEVCSGYGLTETAPVATTAQTKVKRHLRGRHRPSLPPRGRRLAAGRLRSARCRMPKCATCRATWKPWAKWWSAATT